MKPSEVKLGAQVRLCRHFGLLPKDTQGVIDADFPSFIMVAWNLAGYPLPKGYREWPGTFNHAPWNAPNLVRSGFDKKTELGFLEIVKED